VSQPGTLVWFARHELGLSWRDWLSLLTAGKRRRRPMIAIAIVILAIIAHLLAYAIIAPLARAGITPDKPTLAILTGGAFLSWSLMLSQAMESVTRAFYARADLDLILSSPAPARRIFAIRIGAIVFSTTLMAMALAVPFINILAIFDGPQWFAAYGVLFAMGAVSTIVAAVVGAGFVIGIQAAAILSYGSLSRITFLQSDVFLDLAPDPSSLFWWPARAAMGDVDALVAVMILSGVVLFGAIRAFSARFGYHVIAASSVAMGTARTARRTIGFRQASTRRVLRRKEWTLLRRDPWLVSQTLMQVLYLLPPALLLWRNFAADVGTLLIMVPVLVMAAGQLAGGLAWLAVSGEDAPDLVDSAPISAGSVILAKVEAVMAVIAIVTAPMLIALAFASVKLATVAAFGIGASALSAILIQIWFRTQASRGAFRRRQTSSRIATFAEAFSSILWAGTAGLAVAGSRFAPVLAGVAICMLVFTWMIRPRSTDGA
jgi:ABC-2 type transport system permease protein